MSGQGRRVGGLDQALQLVLEAALMAGTVGAAVWGLPFALALALPSSSPSPHPAMSRQAHIKLKVWKPTIRMHSAYMLAAERSVRLAAAAPRSEKTAASHQREDSR